MPPQEQIRRCAEISVSRGCSFAALAVLTMGVGLSFDLAAAMRGCAALSLLVLAILLWRAERSTSRPYRRTEVWAMLDKKPPVPPEQMQRLIGEALREAYLRYAKLTAAFATGFWLVGTAAMLVPMS
jgi:hypothetical protein